MDVRRPPGLAPLHAKLIKKGRVPQTQWRHSGENYRIFFRVTRWTNVKNSQKILNFFPPKGFKNSHEKAQSGNSDKSPIQQYFLILKFFQHESQIEILMFLKTEIFNTMSCPLCMGRKINFETWSCTVRGLKSTI